MNLCSSIFIIKCHLNVNMRYTNETKTESCETSFLPLSLKPVYYIVWLLFFSKTYLSIHVNISPSILWLDLLYNLFFASDTCVIASLNIIWTVKFNCPYLLQVVHASTQNSSEVILPGRFYHFIECLEARDTFTFSALGQRRRNAMAVTFYFMSSRTESTVCVQRYSSDMF